MNQDDEYLRMLTTFHYVLSGVAGAFSLIPVAHLVAGWLMLAGAAAKPDQPFNLFLGWFIVSFASFWILCGFTFAICLAFAGKFLAQRRHYTFCLAMAGVACIFTPLGTLLGVFTLILLMRDGVKAQFGIAPSIDPARPDA